MKLDTLSTPVKLSSALFFPLHATANAVPYETQVADSLLFNRVAYYPDYCDIIKPADSYIYLNLFDKIRLLKTFANNWDGNGAVSLDEATVSNAIRFLNVLPDIILNDLKEENIVASPYGTIVFEFINSENLISVEIGERKIGFYTEFANEEDVSFEGVLFNQNSLPVELYSSFKILHTEIAG